MHFFLPVSLVFHSQQSKHNLDLSDNDFGIEYLFDLSYVISLTTIELYELQPKAVNDYPICFIRTNACSFVFNNPSNLSCLIKSRAHVISHLFLFLYFDCSAKHDSCFATSCLVPIRAACSLLQRSLNVPERLVVVTMLLGREGTRPPGSQWRRTSSFRPEPWNKSQADWPRETNDLICMRQISFAISVQRDAAC